MRRDLSPQQPPHQRICKMIAIFSNQMVVVRTKCLSHIGQRLVEFGHATIKGSELECVPISRARGIPGLWGLEYAGARGEGVFAAHDLDARMVQAEPNGVQIVVGRGKVVNVEVDFSPHAGSTSSVITARAHDCMRADVKACNNNNNK